MSKELSIERMKSCALKNKNRNNKKINLTVVAHVGLTFSNRFVLKRETKKKMKLCRLLHKKLDCWQPVFSLSIRQVYL